MPPRPTRLRLISWRAQQKNTVRGFCEIELPNGLRIRDVSIDVSHGKAWAGLLGRPVLDEEGCHHVLAGKKQYAALLEWRSLDLSDELSRRIIDLVRAHHPEVLSGGEP